MGSLFLPSFFPRSPEVFTEVSPKVFPKVQLEQFRRRQSKLDAIISDAAFEALRGCVWSWG